MFALFSTISLPAGALAIGGAVIAGLVGLAILGAGTFLIARMVKNRKAAKAGTPATPAATPKASAPLGGLLGGINLGGIAQSPITKEVEGVAAQAAHNFGRMMVHAMVAKMAPWAVPFLPALDGVDDQVYADILAKLGVQAGQPMPPAPATIPTQPSATPVLIPTGHPILDILRGAVEAHQAKVTGK